MAHKDHWCLARPLRTQSDLVPAILRPPRQSAPNHDNGRACCIRGDPNRPRSQLTFAEQVVMIVLADDAVQVQAQPA